MLRSSTSCLFVPLTVQSHCKDLREHSSYFEANSFAQIVFILGVRCLVSALDGLDLCKSIYLTRKNFYTVHAVHPVKFRMLFHCTVNSHYPPDLILIAMT